MRNGSEKRVTAETSVTLSLDIDGTGKSHIKTPCGFLNHMLTLFSKHSGFDIAIDAAGDAEVDYHHTVEDTGICLGSVLKKAAGDKKGIKRYGSCILPMDEALVLCAADASGRGHISFDAEFPTEKTGDFDTQLIREFFTAFAMNAGLTLHIKCLSGENSHHIAEAMFKGTARCLREAYSMDERFSDSVPSTKGVL